jgi:hypothetical protein
MLPAPFYTEVPADLGHDQIWAHDAARDRYRDERMRSPGRRLYGAVGDVVVSGAVMLFTRLRRVLQPELRGADVMNSASAAQQASGPAAGTWLPSLR